MSKRGTVTPGEVTRILAEGDYDALADFADSNGHHDDAAVLRDPLHEDCHMRPEVFLHQAKLMAKGALRDADADLTGECVGSTRIDGEDFLVVRPDDDSHVPQPIGTPVEAREGRECIVGRRVVDDAREVVKWLLGWWPGLEDGMSWPRPDPEDHSVYLAAKRIAEYPEDGR